MMLRVLGPMELEVSGQRVPLPRSKKSRALLAYLAVTERPHHRDRLCSLLWDVADDPRGALRWSLSRLRQTLPDDVERLEADRQEVVLRPAGLVIDACELMRIHRAGVSSASTPVLEQAAALYRGELLEGLELPDFLDFTAWSIAQREELRSYHCEILSSLVNRLRTVPDRALPFARQRAQVDAFRLEAQLDLFRLLLSTGLIDEAHRRFEHARRLFRDMSLQELAALEAGWRSLQASGRSPMPAADDMRRASVGEGADAIVDKGAATFVGRQRPLTILQGLLDEVRRASTTHAVLVLGEPGAGKSRLAERVRMQAQNASMEVLVVRAYEAESSRPFGPWAEALGIDVQALAADGAPGSREALFASFRARVEATADKAGSMLLVLDDLQWLDRDSAELLHYLVRTYAHGPLLVCLLARGGELQDNEPVVRVLRSLRREHMLREFDLEPLTPDDVAALVGARAPADVERIHRASAGNPLYALELARSQHAGDESASPTLLQLVRDRIARLPDVAVEILRWGAILGHAIDMERLEALSALPVEDLVQALERLEQSALLRIDTTKVRERYAFSHDIVRQAVYGELSHPRRRLMHRKVAQLLESSAADPAVAADVAHHASLAGEAQLGVRACILAGQQALRVFANSDAEALARRGLRLADELDEVGRVSSGIELLQVLYAARTPDRQEAVTHVRGLAERALDLGLTHAARLGFQTLSYLRWESSSMADAHANILQAERVSRSADPIERAAALAQAARCLVLLEKNLGQAEAFVNEADAVARREGNTSAAVSFARGMIAAHRGEFDEAVRAFSEAQTLARQQGERLVEFGALEHQVMLAIDRGMLDEGLALARQLVELGARVRPGAEVHAARALHALVDRLHTGPDAEPELHVAAQALRQADAKYELSFVLTRWAEAALSDRQLEQAETLALEALAVATVMGRSSDLGIATFVLARAADQQRRDQARDSYLKELEAIEALDLSAASRARIAAK